MKLMKFVKLWEVRVVGVMLVLFVSVMGLAYATADEAVRGSRVELSELPGSWLVTPFEPVEECDPYDYEEWGPCDPNTPLPGEMLF